MKNKFKLLALGGLSAILLISSFAFCQAQDVKKTRHIKMIKIEDGKKMQIDTVLTGDDVFVWNGDTINPEKHMKGFSPSEFDRMHPDPMYKGKKGTRIYRHRDMNETDPLIMQDDSAEDIQIISEDGDSVGQNVIIHKRLRNGDENDHFIYLNDANNGHFPPMPPVPPVPPMRRFREEHSSRSINLNDPNVISFKKKDIGGGREKIEIIRNKTNKAENMNFDMNFDENIQVPEPPMPPAMEGTTDQDAHENMLKQEGQVKSIKAEKKAQRKASRENK